MEFRVLGTVGIVRDGEVRSPGGAKERAILGALLVDPGRPVSVDALLDALWEDAPRDAAARSLSVRIARLRAFLEPDRVAGAAPAVLVRDAAGYRLAIEPEQVDAGRFEAAVRRAADAPPQAALALLDDALAMWRGPPFADLAHDGPVLVETRRLLERRRQAAEARAGALVALGRLEEAIPALEQLVESEPLREEIVRALMTALYRAGRQVDALGAYRALSERLLELGLQPVRETRELERRILDQDPALAAPAGAGAAAAAADPAPWPAPHAVSAGPAPSRPVHALAGRAAELAVLRQALSHATRGERRTLLLRGEAGVGKTAVLEAFLAEATGWERLRIAAGQCLQHRGPTEPYLPVLDALGSLARGPGGDEAVAVLGRHAPTWLVQLPWLVDDEDAAALERRVRGATRERMLRELLDAVERLADRAPLILALEDLHWADDPTIDLLAALARRRAPARLLVLGSFRPAAAGRLGAVATELSVEGACEQLAVGRLPRDDVAALVAARFPGGAAAELVDALMERTAGNPLFVRLLVEHWLASGAVSEAAGAARVRGELRSAGVPGTLRAHLEDQLAALPAGDAEILEAAAVTGLRFDPAALAAALERPAEEVEERCAALARATPLIERRNGAFAFAHDLEREVFADRIPADRRCDLHARIGAHLEAVYGAAAPEHAAELARHFVAGRDAERAVRFLRLSAQRALARHAHAEGVRDLRAALDVTATIPPGSARTRLEVELLAQLGQALVAFEGWSSPAAEEALVRAHAAAAQLDDNEPLVAVLLALATLCEVRGEIRRADELTRECLRRAPVEDRTTHLESNELLACSLFHQGAFLRALEHAEAGLELFSAGDGEAGHYATFPATFGDNAGVSCHDWAGLALWFLGRPDEALQRARLALDLAADPGRAYSRATARAQLAAVHACRRESEAALRWAQATIESATAMGYAYRVAMGRVLRGWSLARLGDPETGIEELAAGLAQSRATGARMDDPHYLALLAEAQLLAGDRDACAATVDEALRVSARERSRYYEPELHRLRAAVAADAEAAEAALRQAIGSAHEQGSRSLELRAATDLVTLLATRPGRAAEARAELAALLRGFDQGHATPDLRAAAAAVGKRAVGVR